MSPSSACSPRERWEPACLHSPSQLSLTAIDTGQGGPDCALISPHAHPLPVPAIQTTAGWRLRPSLEKELSVGAAREGGQGSWGCRQGAVPSKAQAR